MAELTPTVKYIESEMIRQVVPMVELAQRMNVPYSTVYRIMTGQRVPGIDTVEAMFAALNLPPIGKNSVEVSR